MENAPAHEKLEGIVDYTAALDALCKLALHHLCIFEKNYEGLGFNDEARYQTLRHFLLANPANRLMILTHDPRYLATHCPRITMLLQQFGNSLFIFQTPKNLQHLTEPFAIADDIHYVRRFHFDDPRGIFAQHAPESARALKSRFNEMWANSHQAIAATKLGL